MATSTDVPIYTTTLSSTTTSVVMDVSAFQNYKNLKIVYSAQNSGSSGAVLGMRFNSDAGSNYSATYGYGTGSSYASGGEANQNGMSAGDIPASSSGAFSVNTIYINNYSNTTMYKTAVMRHNSPGVVVVMSTGMWRSTAAITSIEFYGATFTVGSTFSVYGIGTASPAKATGGAIYSDSNYWYHVFVNTAAFVPTQSLTADVLVVAGGGAGNDGGGGAGGVLYTSTQSLANATSYTCTVGGGGSGSSNGTNSSLIGGSVSLSAIGGGKGGEYNAIAAGNGGSGGGAARISGAYGTATSGQGYRGGSASVGGGNAAGGGGGAGAIGGDNSGATGGAGGVGTTTYNSWSLATGIGELSSGTYYLAGGGGGFGGTTAGAAGLGGGGTGSQNSGNGGTNGLANTGGGGGGRAGSVGWGAGGSGVVIVRYAK